MNIYNIIQLLSRVKHLRRNERFSRPQLLSYQNDALSRLRKYAYEHSPFYQKFHDGLTDRPLNELPVMTKKILMENFDTLVTDHFIKLADVRDFIVRHDQDRDVIRKYRGRYVVTATSGSSGYPGIFLFNESEWNWVIASFARAREWSGIRIGLLPRLKIAMVASNSHWHMSTRVSVSARTWSTPFICIPATTPMEKTVQQLNRWQPNLLVAYAAMANELAGEQLSGRLHISPGKIYTSAELLSKKTRDLVGKAWGNKLYNEYGATETANIAAENHPCRNMHIFEDLLIIENVDENNEPVAPGQYGAKLLVTNLFSFTQPLIRYEINDRVKFSASACHGCEFPFSIIEDIQGRKENILYLSGVGVPGKKVSIQPLVFNQIMDILPVEGWQVIQGNNESLTVLLIDREKRVNVESVIKLLQNKLSAEGATIPSININLVNEIPRSPSGKTPSIISECI